MFKHGGVSYPLTSATTNSLLRDADPALYFIGEYLGMVLHHYIGARLASQAAIEGLTIVNAVAQRIHVDPAPFLLADQFRFPALVVHRSEESYSDRAIGIDQDTAEWEFAYLLPPLNPRQVQVLSPILRSAAQVIRRALRRGQDASYSAGADVLSLAGIATARVTSVKYGGYEPIQEIPNYYRAINGTIQVVEVDGVHADAFELYDGDDIDVDHNGGTDAVYVDLAQATTGPRIVGLTPTTGPAAGGTVVTITGTGFAPGMFVLFETLPATGVTFVNDITIQCTTPALAAGVASVTVTDAEGRSDTMTNAFTFV